MGHLPVNSLNLLKLCLFVLKLLFQILVAQAQTLQLLLQLSLLACFLLLLLL